MHVRTTQGWDLRGSAARRLYERHGFVTEREDPVDVFMVRRPGAASSS